MSAEEKNDSTAAETAADIAGKTAKKPAATKKKRGRPSKAELAARAAGTPSPSLESPQPTASVQSQESAPTPTETTGTPPAAAATNAAPPKAPAPAQPTVSPPGEQPMSNRQRRRMEWLARAAQRNGNRPNFKGGKHYSSSSKKQSTGGTRRAGPAKRFLAEMRQKLYKRKAAYHHV